MRNGKMCIVLNGDHGHGFTCEKGRKGSYACRMAMPRGTNPITQPLLLEFHADERSVPLNIRADVRDMCLDEANKMIIDSGYDVTNNQHFIEKLKARLFGK